MIFQVEITDLDGNVVADVTQREQTECPVPINDGRTASVRIPIGHAAAAEVKSLERMLRVYYRPDDNDDPAFWGVIGDPDWHFKEGYVDVPAADQWFRLNRSFARFGDDVVGPSTDPHPPNSPTDYTTIRKLIVAAENTAAQQLAGYPDLGIKRTGTGASNSASAAAGGHTMQIERGSNIAQKIMEIIKGAYGPDVQLYPKLGLGASGSGTPFYVALRTFDLQGTDRTSGGGALTFRCVEPEDPMNPNNVADATWNPQGSQVRNHHTSVVQGDASQAGVRVQASHGGAFALYGPLSGWDNPSGTNTKRVSSAALEAHALSVLERYAHAPNFITLEAKVEPSVGTNPWPQWLQDFDVGDRVLVEIDKDNLVYSGEVRITRVHPVQVDAADNARVDIEVVPHVAAVDDIVTAVDD